MKPQELMIGNWVMAHTSSVQVLEITREIYRPSPEEPAVDYRYFVKWVHQSTIRRAPLQGEGIKPISLTPEWLERAGFEYLGAHNKFYPCIEMPEIEYCSYDFKADEFFIGGPDACISGHGLIVTIQYIHQLQNLYFALTGKELKFKA